MVRKPVNELTASDMLANPVWEYALDEEGLEGQDETTVRPCRFDGAVDPSDGMFMVRASFVLADGTRMMGFLTPPTVGDQGDLGIIQPLIISPKGHVGFWCGAMAPKPREITESYERLDKISPDQVFPVQFVSVVELVGGPVQGEIPGFLVLDWETREVRIVT